MAEIDAALLADVLGRDAGKVQQALDKVHDGTGAAMPLSFVFVTNPAKPHENALIDYLEALSLVDLFIGALRALGEDIEHQLAPAAQLAAIRDGSLDPAQFAAFLIASQAFRCRIRVNGHVMGSGILVSYRLVLTAWHVVNRREAWDPAQPPVIEIVTSDGRTLRARPAEPSSPCHPAEWQGLIPNDNDLTGLDDFALLRLSEPVGFTLGFAKLKCPPDEWHGNLPCFLVHYPLGASVGLTPGEATFGQAARRYRHTAHGAQGSSGGGLFSNRCELIGVHQKVFSGNQRCFVPMRNLANNDTAELVQVLRQDRLPTYLWSLDGSLDSHLVIGRRGLFDALDQIVDPTSQGAERLRGIWIRRKRPDEDQSGMSFAYDLLKAFVARRQPDARVERVGLLAGENDVIAVVEAALGLTGASVAQPGVRADETTPVAFDADRAEALVRRFEAGASGPLWLYIDGPKEELSSSAVRQLEQLLPRLIRTPSIRLVLTRMESHSLPVSRFDSLGELADRGPAGLIYEYAGDFSLEDVVTTVRAACSDLGLPFSDAEIRAIAQAGVQGIDTAFGLHPVAKLAAVADRLAQRLRPHVVAAA